MHWQEAIRKSSMEIAIRDAGEVDILRYSDGSCWCPGCLTEKCSHTEPSQIEGFLDWEPFDR